MNEKEQEAVLAIGLMAAFADGAKDEREREQIGKIMESLAPGGGLNLPALYTDVLLKRRTMENAAVELKSPEAKQLAYEMAVCVCDADGVPSEAEAAFLERLRATLNLEAQPARTFAHQAEEIAAAPLEGPAAETRELDSMILNYSILNGALELLPQTLASMAILPLQTKMVYRIGKAHGFELDRGHIKDFAASLGVGLAGQYVEQIGRRLIGGLLKKAGGRKFRGIAGAATGVAFSFATTYALGQVAKHYYAGGRTIDTGQLQQMFSRLLDEGKSLQNRYAGEIQQKAQTIDVNQIVSLVRQ